MALTYGFYNSIDGDRAYNAEQMGMIFDGIIEDGVYANFGNHLAVEKNTSEPMTINVKSGRAWFNHTWSYNDVEYPMTLDDSELLLNRIDAVVLEIDSSVNERRNSFKIVKGTPASTPQRPTMIQTTTVHQYPLAYIYIGTGVEDFTQANITNAIGTAECPFVTGILQSMSIDSLVAQWQAQFTEWNGEKKIEFEEWLSHLQDELDENPLGHLQNQIDEIKDTREITINSNAWVYDSVEEYFTFIATVPGMTENGEPDVWPKREESADVDDINEAFGYIFKAITDTNRIAFYATEQPAINLTLFVKGVY